MTKCFCAIKDADGNACPIMDSEFTLKLFSTDEEVEEYIRIYEIGVPFGYETYNWETFGD